RRAGPLLPKPSGELSRHFFLIEHGRGVSCARLRAAEPGRIAFASPELPFGNGELHLHTEARILGVVDLELRFEENSITRKTSGRSAPGITSHLGGPSNPQPVASHAKPLRPCVLVKQARLAAGLSFRLASKLSRTITLTLGDSRYFTAPGTLSDY